MVEKESLSDIIFNILKIGVNGDEDALDPDHYPGLEAFSAYFDSKFYNLADSMIKSSHYSVLVLLAYLMPLCSFLD